MLGILFIILSNYFRILTPQITGYVVNAVESEFRSNLSANRLPAAPPVAAPNAVARVQPTAAEKVAAQTAIRDTANYDILVRRFIRVNPIYYLATILLLLLLLYPHPKAEMPFLDLHRLMKSVLL